MSDFLRHNAVATDFSTSHSWVILSPIEQSIKKKIEGIGVPLKDWNIQINYGIKTGYNDAFIVKTEIRDQILANCADEDERRRTDELIRPYNSINDTLTIHDCIFLDTIQKEHRIDDKIAQELLKRALIEGEYPNYTIYM